MYEAGEASNRVTVIANLMEFGINKSIMYLQDFMNDDSVGFMKVNKDYISIPSNGQDTRTVMEMYLAGTISYETYIHSLQKQEVIDVPSIEEEIKRIETATFKPEPLVKEPTTNTVDNKIKQDVEDEEE